MWRHCGTNTQEMEEAHEEDDDVNKLTIEQVSSILKETRKSPSGKAFDWVGILLSTIIKHQDGVCWLVRHMLIDYSLYKA